MPSLAYGLMQGLTGYMQGRDQRAQRDRQAEQVDYERAQQARASERQAMLDERQRVQMDAQAEAMRQAAAERQRDEQRRMQLDRRDAADRGEAPVTQVAAQGATLMGASGAGPMADTMTRTLGAGLAQRAQTPTYQIGDTGYVKAGPSLAEQSAERMAAQRKEERASDAAAQQARDVEQNRLQMERDRANRASMEKIAGMRIAGDGQPPRGNMVPGGAIETIASNARTLDQIDAAIATLESGDGKGHIGPSRRFLPNMVSQLTDPAGDEIRGLVAGIGSLQYKDLSGAAVSVSEDKRLQPSIPRADDTPDAALAKLRRLKQSIESIDGTVRAYYTPENGYRPIPQRATPTTKTKDPNVNNDRPPLDSFVVRR